MTTRAARDKRPAWYSILLWFDTYAADTSSEKNHTHNKQVDWLRTLPFILLHLSVLFVFVVGWSPFAIGLAIGLYALRMFAITAFYHRYFSHKAFKTSRAMQFIFAVIGASAIQRGPLWWASHHRSHHAHADNHEDAHSPSQHGFLWSHMGWFLARENFAPRLSRINDFCKFPELRFIDRFDIFVPLIMAVMIFLLGEWLASSHPALATNGWQLVVWTCISTVFLYHVTFTVNSLAHRYGRRRFNTHDDSRNNLLLALLTFGEGWHNNHHYYPGSARQGFVWWEIDLTYYILRFMQSIGLIWSLRPVPQRVLSQCNTRPEKGSN